MLRELLSIFGAGNPLQATAESFSEMLGHVREMTVAAGDIFFRKTAAAEERSRIYNQDVRVNKLERSIRKSVVAHLSVGGNTADLPYCLLLMSLVKDVERLGDYAKNLSEVVDLYTGDLPEDDIVSELREIRAGVEEALLAMSRVLAESDRDTAFTLIHQGKDLAKRADGLLTRIARSSYDAGKVSALVLGARYYKRIGGHVLNLLSSVVMPLHKIDYYDERELPNRDRESGS